MLQIEQYGYDESVHVMVQPWGKFIDYTDGQAASIESKVFENVHFGAAFFVPADRDILVSFMPISVYATNPVK